MTDGTPGWYLDSEDPSLARWHDGTEWTEHTLVIADQEPGSDPPPPPAVRRPSDAALQRERVAAAEARRAEREAARMDTGGRYPRWVPVAVAVLVGLLGAGAFALLGGDDDGTTKLDTEEAASIDEAVDAARDAGFPEQIGDARASGLIEDLCEAADRPARTAALSTELARLPLEPEELSRAIRALGVGAEAYCPSAEDGIETALGQLQSQAGVDGGLATDTTLPSVDGGVVDGSVTTIADPNAPTTTAPRTTATTRKPTTSSTAAPTTTTTAAPTTTTTIVTNQKGFGCPSEGATSVTKQGTPLVCRKSCYGPSQTLRWDYDEPCSTVPATN